MDTLISQIEEKLPILKRKLNSCDISSFENELRLANQELKNYIKEVKNKLVNLELRNGIFQYLTPEYTETESKPVLSEFSETKAKPLCCQEQKLLVQQENVKQTTNPINVIKDDNVNVSKLDFRIGKILEVQKHPDADALYVEKVDIGEVTPRTIISGLVKHVPIDKMQGLIGVFLCNLKPAKMRGIESQGMLMCASAADTQGVEPLTINCDSFKPGDRVIVADYPGDPEVQLNPKKKILEQVKPDLMVSQDGIALYKNSHWIVEGHPDSRIVAPNLRNVPIA